MAGQTRHRPSINQIAITGEITSIAHKPGRTFEWTFDVAVYREYGGDDVEAHLTCGAAAGFHGDMIANSKPGDWVTVQGKIKTGGFIQVRSCTVFEFRESEAIAIAEENQQRERERPR